ncbi:DUF58 domain-containing protein [Membranihabitans maritimus]|uniref:DUF58 domain-containing protein n=1 Tax=Membranihabitans maritimus TaxID=2904244 RepID=UPI001F345152|nr:DUF58 domain-containing protein [Membranihabitans maritimus]
MASLNETYSLHEVENFELLAKQVVEGFIIGLHQSPYHGFSAEFAEHKLYNPGESTKNIDWKVFARTDKLFNKRYDDETNLRCQIVIDSSSSMTLSNRGKGINQLSKIQWSALASASFMYLLKKQRDAFGLTLFDESIHLHRRASGSLKQMRLLMSYLDDIYHNPPDHSKTTNIAEALHEVAERIKKRSLVVIFSDFFDQMDNLDPVFSALQHLKYNKNEVIVFNVIDLQKEVEFKYSNKPMKFIDYETGETLKVRPQDLQSVYRERMDSYLNHLKLKCMQFGIDFQLADINRDFNDVLRAFLIRRNKSI